jgi:sugar lactone lactonase YvrE
MQAVTRALSVLSILAVGLGVNAQTPKVFTVAGGHLGSGVPATSASLSASQSVAVDAKGDIYVTDGGHCRIRKIDKNGVIASFAGTGICGYSGDGGPAHLAMISPAGIAFDLQGDLLIADDSRIRKIAKDGVITTIAGNGTLGYSGDGGPATQATLYYPTTVSSDTSGKLYISDSHNAVIRMVDTAGNIHTVAGNGTWGFSGDGGPATSAQFGPTPEAVCTDGNGAFYVADTNNYRVRKIDSTGTITTFAGNGPPGNVGSGNGGPATSATIGSPFGLLLTGGKLYISTNLNIWAVDLTTQLINIVAGTNRGGFNGDGNAALSTLFAQPWGMAIDHAGDLLVADFSNDRVRRIDSSQIVTTIAGGYVGDGKLATRASLDLPQHIAFDPAGNLYISDETANRVRKVSTSGIITTFAGTGITGYSGDGGAANAATLNQPDAVAADKSGNIFIADLDNGAIRKVDTLGTITTFASNIVAFAIATDAIGNVYASDFEVVWKITPAGSASIFAGSAYGYGGDNGPATQARLALPEGIAVDTAGNVYIMDTNNFRIRKVDTSGIISTIAGNGSPGYSGDGGPATAASLSDFSLDVAADGKGNIYIADSINARVRIVDASGTIRTYAGTGNYGYNGNSLPATQTNMFPEGLAINAKGVVYVSDGNERVRKIH